MALGRCDYLTCGSLLGSSFRASFRVGWGANSRRMDREVLLCPDHERLCRPLRESMADDLRLTIGGAVFTNTWLEALLG